MSIGTSTKRSFEQMQKIILERYDASDFSTPMLALPLPEPAPTQVIKRSRSITSQEAVAAAEAEAARIKDVDVDIVCEDLYERMEDPAYLDILGGLELEQYSDSTDPHSSPLLAPSSPCGSHDRLLWDVVATPTMMHSFGATVAGLTLPVPAL